MRRFEFFCVCVQASTERRSCHVLWLLKVDIRKLICIGYNICAGQFSQEKNNCSDKHSDGDAHLVIVFHP